MKIEGRITRIMPTRSGTSQQSGNQWKALPFVFSFYDDNPRYEDSVLLETFDTNIMAQLAQFVEKGPDGKAIEENGSMKLNVLHIPCKVGFGHRVRYCKRQDGTAFTMNEVRLFEFELMTAAFQFFKDSPHCSPSTAIFLPEKFHGQRSLVGCGP